MQTRVFYIQQANNYSGCILIKIGMYCTKGKVEVESTEVQVM